MITYHLFRKLADPALWKFVGEYPGIRDSRVYSHCPSLFIVTVSPNTIIGPFTEEFEPTLSGTVSGLSSTVLTSNFLVGPKMTLGTLLWGFAGCLRYCYCWNKNPRKTSTRPDLKDGFAKVVSTNRNSPTRRYCTHFNSVLSQTWEIHIYEGKNTYPLSRTNRQRCCASV